jgi:hypothetical protein
VVSPVEFARRRYLQTNRQMLNPDAVRYIDGLLAQLI